MSIKKIDVKKAAALLRAQIEGMNRQQDKLQGLPEEFHRRYRAWCLTECQAEYSRNFRFVKLVRNPGVFLVLEYLGTLQSEEARLQFVTALSKRDNSDVALNSEDQQIIAHYIQFGKVPFAHSSGEVLGYLSRVIPEEQALKDRSYYDGTKKQVITRQLRSGLKKAGKGRLGNLILERTSALRFEKQIGIGYVVTGFDFSGWHQMRYVHTIYAEPGGRLGTNISKGISVLGWMGISESTWDWLIPEDIPGTIQGVLELCEHFFQAAETLLAGLVVPPVG
jgi:hypothetical protein